MLQCYVMCSVAKLKHHWLTHLTDAQFAYFGQAGHAILDEHDSRAAACRQTSRLWVDLG